MKARNWKQYQHYNKPKPPWIKLYRDILNDYDFQKLKPEMKWTVLGLFMLAAETDNDIPNDPEWIKYRLGLSKPASLKEIAKTGFFDGLDTESRQTLDTESRQTLDTESRQTLDTESRQTLEHESRQTLYTESRDSLGTESRECLDLEEESREEDILIDFQSWYDRYGKKRGRAKAEQKWTKLTDQERRACLETVDAYVKLTPEQKYRKDPLTFLNGKHWEDDYTEAEEIGLFGMPAPTEESNRAMQELEDKIAEEESNDVLPF